MQDLKQFATLLCFPLLTGCTVAKHQGPWAQDMFTVFDGHPSTAAERDAATSDCVNYAYNTPTQTTVITGAQICMLQLGFRAPNGGIPGTANGQISEGSCGIEPDLPVCMAVKDGWPLHPIPRWTRPNTTRYRLEGDASVCAQRNIGIQYAQLVPRMDKCMIGMGYTVAHPHSPIDIWPPEKDWPNCAKPEDERNWIEKKWCPSESLAAPMPSHSASRDDTQAPPLHRDYEME